MWIPVEPLRHDLPDVERFIAALDAAEFFDRAHPVILARAPGRLDLMGGIADYSGSLVLELPLAAAAIVAVQPDECAEVRVRSQVAAELGGLRDVVIPVADLAACDYYGARALFAERPEAHWAAYVAGALVGLHIERGVPLRGMRLLLESDVPPGKGVSSSAAIEVATMRAVCGALGIELNGRELALLCQTVENLVVGAPCGVMDQMTAALGEEETLLALLCQPAEPSGPIVIPHSIEVWGIDSGIRHAVSGADYGSVRVGAFIGYRILADLAGLTVQPVGDVLHIQDSRWHGYLANVTPSEWEALYRDRVPLELRGAEFLAHYGGTTDRVTIVEPDRVYAVRQPTAHPIYEHQRVRLFAALLESLADLNGSAGAAHAPAHWKQRVRASPTEERLILLGELMYQSHASYSACGLGADGTDRLVELVRAAGPHQGLYGAKITGGGSGGVVAVLARSGARRAVERIAAQYQRETGHDALLIGGSSPGAMSFGTLTLAYT